MTRARPPWVVAACCALLSACAARVSLPPTSSLVPPANWRTSFADKAEAGPDRTWWRRFGDPHLAALVERALRQNGDIKVARARVVEYRARMAQASAGRMPTLFADATPTRVRALAYNGHPYVTNVASAELVASYEVDLWGRLQQIEQGAAASYQAEQAGADALALAIAASAAAGYFNLRGLDAQLDLAIATLSVRERSRTLAQRQFEAGYSARLEWLQAQSEYQVAAEQVPQLRRAIYEQENSLSLLAGGNPGPVDRGLPLEMLAAPPVPGGLPSELLRRRPDIVRAERNVIAAHAALAATRDQLLPSLRLTAVGGVQATSLSQFIHAPVALWHLTGSLLEPLFDGARIQSQTDAAAAQRDQTIYQYENVVRAAFAETDNGLGALLRLREQTVDNDARRATAAETLRVAHQRYRNGYASYLEELDAQRSLYAADVSHLQLKARLLVASVDLYRALGGGWGSAP